ncbi:hypothetical protein [Arthrobacter koreensis]|uniref:hypothetical protein n=1 Tax=Arthrobacter koreensis TaxID=199136 RepID=UPI002DBFE20C|nr:hypothetical protein [Arthrobacter koreensis]MEB7505093.1 hypothetical protein [Arthrobacter koreensis]
MGKRLYAEAAAARHMSSGTKRSASDDSAASAPFSVQLAPRTDPAELRAYRRKRAVAWVLTVLVMASVPALIAALVLFG